MSGFITHNDADGIISALIFKQFNDYVFFKGFYNLKTIYSTSPINCNEDIAVDLDMNNMESIGHHINPYNNLLANNPNNKYLDNKYKEFYSKCPLNTVMILLDKYKIKITTLRQLSLTLFADGFFTYYDKYTENCNKWLERYNLQYLITMYLENKEEVLRIINEEIVPIFSTEGKYNSLKIQIKDGELQNKEIVKEFSQYVIDSFNFYVVPTLFDKNYNYQVDYIVKEYSFSNYEEYKKVQAGIIESQKRKNIVSSAMVFKDLIKVTMVEDEKIY